MEENEIYVGVDVSKDTLDFWVLASNQCSHYKIENQSRSIKKLINSLDKQVKGEKKINFGVENTGKYGWALLELLSQTNHSVYLLSPLHLAKSLGLVRGKTDRIDCERIARFLMKNKEELTTYQAPREQIRELQLLLSRRSQIQGSIKREKLALKDLQITKASMTKRQIISECRRSIKALKLQLERIEKLINELVNSDELMRHQKKLLMTIPGVGKVVSWYMILKTNEFKNIKDPRKLACYAGVAPFEHSSGTSVRGRTRVSYFADKTLKKILHMAAMRVIQLEGELREYYIRKVQQGKNKMSVINALRNKIIHRIMAVIREQKPYQKNFKNHLIVS